MCTGEVNAIDSRVFWFSQYVMGVAWIIFAIVAVFSLNISNLTVCIVGAGLSLTNTLGYIRCDKNHQKKVSTFFMKKAQNNLSSEQLGKLGMMAMSQGSVRGTIQSQMS